MTKDDVAAALEEIGTLLQLTGENDFRVKAYSNGARPPIDKVVIRMGRKAKSASRPNASLRSKTMARTR